MQNPLKYLDKTLSLQHMHFLVVPMIQANQKGDSLSRGTFKMVKYHESSFSPQKYIFLKHCTAVRGASVEE
jgi:hypothetical protein